MGANLRYKVGVQRVSLPTSWGMEYNSAVSFPSGVGGALQYNTIQYNTWLV